MNLFKLIINQESFLEDFVFTLKVLSLNQGQKNSSDVLILLPENCKNENSNMEEKLNELFEEEKLKPYVRTFSNNFIAPDSIRYIFILTDKNKRIKKMSANSFSSGITLIYTASFPEPYTLKKLPYFNAAKSKNNNYSLI